MYRNLYNPDFYVTAYSKIYSNKGSSTSGIDDETADGFSEDGINRIIQLLKDESYQPKPARRTYIPKKNGKTRPLGIPSYGDRLVQEVCRMMLEAIYEPTFSKSSHGFRPKRSCHTALDEVRNRFKGVNWFIEGDIKGFFDNIDHQTLISILRRKITDERFIRLIWKFLRAGYMEKWKFHNTFSGTPQGGIVSPILANIYLNELDNYVQGKLTDETSSTNAVKPKEIRNPTYRRIDGKMERLYKKIDACKDSNLRDEMIAEHKALRKQRSKVNYSLGLGYDYHNLFYVRYADDCAPRRRKEEKKRNLPCSHAA